MLERGVNTGGGQMEECGMVCLVGLFISTYWFSVRLLLNTHCLNGKRQENKHSQGVYCDTEKWVTTRRKKGFNFTPSCRKIKLQSVR